MPNSSRDLLAIASKCFALTARRMRTILLPGRRRLSFPDWRVLHEFRLARSVQLRHKGADHSASGLFNGFFCRALCRFLGRGGNYCRSAVGLWSLTFNTCDGSHHERSQYRS